RLVQRAAVELRLGLALEHPVDPRIGVGLRVAERDVDPRVAGGPARFEQQHAVFSRLAEPTGDRATGRTGAGHDEIKSFWRACHNIPPDFAYTASFDLNQTKAGREGRRAADYSAFSIARIASIIRPGAAI